MGQMFAEDFCDSAPMSSEAQQFAVVVLEGFKAAGRYTDDEIGEAGGPSTTTLTKLRKVAVDGGEMSPPRGDTLRRIDTAAEWRPGSARALWETGTTPERVGSLSLAPDLDDEPVAPEDLRQLEKRVGDAAQRATELRAQLVEAETELNMLVRALARSLPKVDKAGPNLSAAAKTGKVEPPGEFD